MKPHARHRDMVAAVQALPAQCSVPVRVAKVFLNERTRHALQTDDDDENEYRVDVSQLNLGWDHSSRYGSYLIW